MKTEKRKEPKLAEIAERIREHLRRFEADKAINVPGAGRISPYYCVNAWPAGRYVGVRYVSFQTHSNLTREEATRYLKWLDDGNVGQHWRMERQ